MGNYLTKKFIINHQNRRGGSFTSAFIFLLPFPSVKTMKIDEARKSVKMLNDNYRVGRRKTAMRAEIAHFPLKEHEI
jgi:hypothetical protein